MGTILVVGAGFAGSVVARELADAGKSVLVIDKRNHIGGNAYDELDSNGILVHRYGPHIFHTNSKQVFDYLSRFTGWRKYEHRVMSCVDGIMYPFPVNRLTLNQVFGVNLPESKVQSFLDCIRRTDITRPQNTEELVLSTLGERLYKLFYYEYTRKQWGLEPRELKTSVAARIPVRTNDDDRYFTDAYQAMPDNGYTCLFKKLLDSPNIEVRLNTHFLLLDHNQKFEHVFYTGPIDEYFRHSFGKLPYRSLRFEHYHYSEKDSLLPTATVNYPNENAITRATEFKKITGQLVRGTSIVREYPVAHGDPYYPIPTDENEELYRKYRHLSNQNKDVTFLGRLGRYKYYNMDQVVAEALTVADLYLEGG